MEFKERKKLRKDMQYAGTMLLVAIVCLCLSKLLFNPQYEDLKDQIGQTSVIAQRISATNDEAGRLSDQISMFKKQYVPLAENKDAYIAYLGELAQRNDLNINKMTVGDIFPTGSLYSLDSEIELQGDLYNIKNFVHQLYESEKVARILSVSYRVQNKSNLKWMWRRIDDAQLVPWWDVDTDTALSFAAPDDSNIPLISADELMSHQTALCYLIVEFLGTGGE